MVRGRRKAEWGRAGTIAALLYNAHKGKGQSAKTSEDFYREASESNGNAEFREFNRKQKESKR